MGQHTPGPWIAREIGTATPSYNEYVSVFEIQDANGRRITQVAHPDHALIAAAPELLEALARIAHSLVPLLAANDYEEGRKQELINLARAAIARATGDA